MTARLINLRIVSAFVLISLIFESTCFAIPSYHLVGWVNAVVPGAGQAILGDYKLAATQAVIEGGTFGYGYSLSARKPLTIDGVPENLPIEQTHLFNQSSHQTVCLVHAANGSCQQFGTLTTTNSVFIGSTTPGDFSKPLYADILQEFGLKYHMVNVFNAYREAAKNDPNSANDMIDQRDTMDMFKDPFRIKNVLNPWVLVPLALVGAATWLDYNSTANGPGLTPIQTMNSYSNFLFGFNYTVWQPFGSGAPEEMFYRGFMQNEFYHMVPSPFFAIPLSTAAFAFSHAPQGRVGAAIAGGYLGFLDYFYDGYLAPGITLHFWSVVFLGIETTLLTRKAEGYIPPAGANISYMF